MKAILVCVSVSHGNTRKVADAIAGILDARVVEPEAVTVEELAACDLVGFGSGIFGMRFHPRLRRLVQSLPDAGGQKAFVFATSGSPELPVLSFTWPLTRALEAKAFEVVGTFTCRGLDTWWPLRLIGGINKGRPHAGDLDAARRFASGLRERLDPAAGSALDGEPRGADGRNPQRPT